MPNWAYTQYKATGDKNQLQKLYSTMKELEEMKDPGLLDNGFGSTWLGNLVFKLGGDWSKIYCRGEWGCLEIDSDILYFSAESAWGEMNEVRKFLEEKFPGIKIYYQCEEPGMGIYITNDDTDLFFPDKYYLWIENEEPTYYSNFEELVDDVKEITGESELETLEDCEKALREHSMSVYEIVKYSFVP